MQASSLVRGVLVLAALAGLYVPSGLTAQRTRVPGTLVSIEPPPGFTPAQQFAGFQKPAAGASIMVTTVPVPVRFLRQGMTAEELATQGVELVSSEPVGVDTGEAVLLHGRQRVAGRPFLKWMLVLGDQQSAHLVVGIYPADLADSLGGPVRRAVLSARAVDASRDPFEGLSFRFDPGDRLKPAPRFGNVLALTLTGSTSQGEPGDPYYLAGTSISPVAVDDLKRRAEQRARQTATVENLRNLQGQELRVDGLHAYEIVADGNDQRSGTPLKLYQVMALEGGNYYLFHGRVGADRAAEYLPEFRRITGSFRRVSPPEPRPRTTP
ncbi:MAG TPA: hypothetical protein VF263_18965 [Longimicrobiaceae bacterium]